MQLYFLSHFIIVKYKNTFLYILYISIRNLWTYSRRKEHFKDNSSYVFFCSLCQSVVVFNCIKILEFVDILSEISCQLHKSCDVRNATERNHETSFVRVVECLKYCGSCGTCLKYRKIMRRFNPWGEVTRHSKSYEWKLWDIEFLVDIEWLKYSEVFRTLRGIQEGHKYNSRDVWSAVWDQITRLFAL